MDNKTIITTKTKVVEELIPYLEAKLKKDTVELAELEKSISEELATLPELEDSKDVKVFVKNAKIKTKSEMLKTKLARAKLIVERTNKKINYCFLTMDLVINNDAFNYINVASKYFQLLDDDINTIEVKPAISINDPKAALIFRDIFSNQYLLVKTALDYEHVYQQSLEILIVDKKPTYEEFLIYKNSEIKYRKQTYNSYGSNYLSEKEYLKRANNELKELRHLTKDEYNAILPKLYSDMQKVSYLKKLREVY